MLLTEWMSCRYQSISKTLCDDYHWTVFHKVKRFELIIKMFNSYQVMLSFHSLNMAVSYVSYIYENTFVTGLYKTRWFKLILMLLIISDIFTIPRAVVCISQSFDCTEARFPWTAYSLLG
jgi:hypothetical protein